MAEEKLRQLVEGCKKYNKHSQQLLYQEFHNFAMRICIRFVNNRYEASEVLNEGFFKALTNIKKFDENKSFTAWLGKIMYHVSIDYYRANLKNNKMEKLDCAYGVEVVLANEQKISP